MPKVDCREDEPVSSALLQRWKGPETFQILGLDYEAAPELKQDRCEDDLLGCKDGW